MTGEGYKLIKKIRMNISNINQIIFKKRFHVSTFVSLHRKAQEARISNQYSVDVGLGIALDATMNG